MRRRHRAFCILFLVYQALWLNVVVPGHTRGAVTLPGTSRCADCPGPGDFDPTPACCRHDTRERGSDRPDFPPSRAARCAICSFAAALTVPPPFDPAPAPGGLLRRLPPPAPADAPSLPPRPGYYGRAPPAAILPA